ncbi:HAD family hydrolase [Halopseudomonas pelagia]|uniref:HAD family hydrolase n=1 Tax=Halopseudomonas pelagia TaxID=553151 RepID=UPI0003A8F3C3|nr:HAD-IA family hydrolase [Halopseudomonas pelagia]|tara:strand:+ start:12937 stop:13617 length:681 start_codon:yes stop_codon:yes gene_type:complete
MLTSVLFDLDGTLLDTADDFMAVILRMRQERGLPSLDTIRIRERVSDGSVGMLSCAFNMQPSDAGFDALREEFLHHYDLSLAVHTRLFDGMPELLDWLDDQGLPWGIVTNKLSRFSVPLLDAMGLASRCRSLVCPDQVSHGKPHPEPLLKACVEMGVKPADSVYVGDHLRDILAGRAAGMPTIAALYGYIPPDEDPAGWQATHSIKSPAELRSWLVQRQLQEVPHA